MPYWLLAYFIRGRRGRSLRVSGLCRRFNRQVGISFRALLHDTANTATVAQHFMIRHYIPGNPVWDSPYCLPCPS
jgi:hypothetical protein